MPLPLYRFSKSSEHTSSLLFPSSCPSRLSQQYESQEEESLRPPRDRLGIVKPNLKKFGSNVDDGRFSNLVKSNHKFGSTMVGDMSRKGRLARRLERYRIRSQEAGQNNSELESQQDKNSIGFSLFCEELASTSDNFIQEFEFNDQFLPPATTAITEQLDTVRLGSVAQLCWLCGKLASSGWELVHHAEEDHYWTEMAAAAGAVWRPDPLGFLFVSCPQCGRQFDLLDSFTEHIHSHYQDAALWLQLNGFTD